jgi:HptB-dependent secretion and biofilm anti anti-sigma factor
MSIDTKKSGDGQELTIFLPEKFDFQLHEEFREAYEKEEKMKSLVLDMLKTSYMDSSALGMMLQLKEHAEKCNGKVSIKNANGNILQILSIANFDKIFSVV